jgi:1-deoxy-D-xylulose-5-phosphate synthase
MKLLERIANPEDLKRIHSGSVPQLAAEIREMLIREVSRTGGHLGPNLGVVELTIAIHRVFDSPVDRILFDTGHQSYVHKILTGRQNGFASLRQLGGMSGFPSRAESEHDLIENSHASTALSYADGLAKARQLRGEANRAIVVVVGDGALTGGMAWEALNNIGAAKDRPVIIVLNDNGRTYQATVGALAAYLRRSRVSQHGCSVSKGSVEDRWRPAAIFNALGLEYVGPVDGYDEPAIEEALRASRDLERPVIVHVLTEKGTGYAPAEQDEEDRMHQIPAVSTTSRSSAHGAEPTWTNVFAEEITAIGRRRQDVVVISAGMLHRLGLARFASAFPDRAFDVGIAEQHAITSAAGLAMGGMRPVVAMHATFLSRAFDQVLMDVALHRLPVIIVLDRAGVTGPDGASHHGMWDVSILRVIPELRILAPRDATRLVESLGEALAVENCPTVIRFPGGTVPADIPAIGRLGSMDVLLTPDCHEGRVLESHEEVLLLGAGSMAGICLQAAELLANDGIDTTVVDPRCLKPMDTVLANTARRYLLVVAVEDNGLAGGFGESVITFLRCHGVTTPVMTHGLPQRFLSHGNRDRILSMVGLAPNHLAERVVAEVAALRPGIRRLGTGKL